MSVRMRRDVREKMHALFALVSAGSLLLVSFALSSSLASPSFAAPATYCAGRTRAGVWSQARVNRARYLRRVYGVYWAGWCSFWEQQRLPAAVPPFPATRVAALPAAARRPALRRWWTPGSAAARPCGRRLP